MTTLGCFAEERNIHGFRLETDNFSSNVNASPDRGSFFVIGLITWDRMNATNNVGHGINPIRPGGGGGGEGGLKGPDDQIHSFQSETSYSMMAKLGEF